jgi:ribosome maturation factor RimP
MNSELEAIVQQEVGELGYDLVEFRRGGTRTRPLLDVRIDRRDGSRVSLDDCAFVSKGLEQKLDAAREAGSDYVLEVSSPGVERPLRGATDWLRFVGRRIRVKTRGFAGAAPETLGSYEVDLLDVEDGDAGTVAVCKDDKGATHRLKVADVIEARLVFVWNRD